MVMAKLSFLCIICPLSLKEVNFFFDKYFFDLLQYLSVDKYPILSFSHFFLKNKINFLL